MNPAKWDAIAEAFAAGAWVPANGWDAWNTQAHDEAVTIRKALPDSVDVLLEVGCGIGRLTPALAILFPHVVATDTSKACRRVTRERCSTRSNVIVMPADVKLPNGLAGRTHAALVWGDLYDSDWSRAERDAHRAKLRSEYALVLEGTAERWMLQWRNGNCITFEA